MANLGRYWKNTLEIHNHLKCDVAVAKAGQTSRIASVLFGGFNFAAPAFALEISQHLLFKFDYKISEHAISISFVRRSQRVVTDDSLLTEWSLFKIVNGAAQLHMILPQPVIPLFWSLPLELKQGPCQRIQYRLSASRSSCTTASREQYQLSLLPFQGNSARVFPRRTIPLCTGLTDWVARLV